MLCRTQVLLTRFSVPLDIDDMLPAVVAFGGVVVGDTLVVQDHREDVAKEPVGVGGDPGRESHLFWTL